MEHWKSKIDDILTTSMTLIADRFEKSGTPLIDTKFDIVSGRDYGMEDEPFRRKECVYSWIQGRGLESLAKHIRYFRSAGNPGLAGRLEKMLRITAAEMERLRQINFGRLPFAMTPEGKPCFEQEPSTGNYSDCFYGKGLFAAGEVLGIGSYRTEGKALFSRVLTAIREQTFRTDQQSFDPKNKVAFVPGKFPQGPRMIALGGLADLMKAEPDDRYWSDTAEEFIRFILEHHVSHGQYPELQKWDFVESLDGQCRIWRDGEMIFSDPGHALEFVGLAGKCLLLLQQQGRKAGLIADAGKCLPEVFTHVFDCGFNPVGGGICKGYDLAARKPVNSDMPWWSLPETVRAGAQLLRLYPGNQTAAIASRTGEAMQAFVQGFLQANGFGCQTRDEAGRIIQVIPAVSDADPGYHTNLSLMDVI